MWHAIMAALLLASATAQGYDNATRLTALSAEALTNLSKELMYLVKAERLSPLSGTVLAAVVRANPENPVLVGKCLLASRTPTQREQLLKGIQNTHVLSETVQMEIAAYMVHWFRDLESWKSERFLHTTRTGSPLLAYMPRTFLYYLSRANQDKFLYHLRAWRWTTSQELEWSWKPRGVKRSWAEMMATASYPVPLKDLSKHEIALQGFLLTGASPDELSQLQLRSREGRDFIMTLPLEPLQARVVFRTAFSTRSRRLLAPYSEHVTPIISLLTPAQIRSLDLNRVNLTGVGTADISRKYKPSWATSAQLAYCLTEQASIFGYVWSEGWSVNALSHVGQWLHALPRAMLTRIFSTNPELLEDVSRIHTDDKVFRALDSSPLTAWQARLIVGHQLDAGPASHFMLRLKGRLLLALNSTSVVHTPVSQLSQRALTHMLTYMPAESPALFPLYLKSWSILNREWVLDAILASKDPSNFLSLLGTSDISPIAGKLRDAISRSRPSHLLPRHTLSLIMGLWRRSMMIQHNDWLNEIMKVPELLPGLRCEDIRALGPETALPVLAMLGDILRDHGAPYPRDLQYCAMSALLNYMKTRKEIHNTESPLLQSLIQDRTKKMSLLDEFEPAEMYSVGGYVLASVPVEILNSSSRWQHVIHAIGRLSMLELLEIFSDTNLHPGKLAEMPLRIEPREIGLATFDLLGNLIQFLPSPEQLVDRIAPRAFRLWLEGMDRREDTALCVPRVIKNTFWYRNILHSYGSSKNWTAGTLDTLGGLLVAVPNSALDQIPFSSWVEAADQLNSHNAYTKQFMQLCTRYLGPTEAHTHATSVAALMRRYLNASRALAASARRVQPSESTSTTPSPGFFKFDAKLAKHLPRILGARTRRNSSYDWFEKITSVPDQEKENGAIISSAITGAIQTTEASPRARAEVIVVDRPADLVSQLSTTESNIIPDIFIETLQENRTQEVNNTSRTILNCGAVRMSAVAAAMVLTEEDLEDLAQSGQLEECLEVLGTMKLSAVTTAAVWKVVQRWNVSVDVRDMGALLSQVDLTVVHNANLSDLDVVTALGRHMETWHQMEQVVTMVLEANNVTDVLSEELAGALGTLTCGLFSLGTGAHLMTPPVFIKVYPLLATLMGNIMRCPPHPCLNGLISIAEGSRILGLGDISTWTAEDVSSLGILAAGFTPQHIASLNAGAEAGISNQALRCMAHESLKTLSTSQIGNLSLTALDTMSPHLMELLSPQQLSAVTAVRSPAPHFLLKKIEISHVPPPVIATATTFGISVNVILLLLCLSCLGYIL